jgi:hypothetical protein
MENVPYATNDVTVGFINQMENWVWSEIAGNQELIHFNHLVLLHKCNYVYYYLPSKELLPVSMIMSINTVHNMTLLHHIPY